jgi:hypothetical protein
LHLQLRVPYECHTLQGVSVRDTKWGLGVFWEGYETLPAGVYFTIYSGEYFEASPQAIAAHSSQYLIELKFYTLYGTPDTENSSWYCNGEANKSVLSGVGQFINSSSPYNLDPVERLPNARYEEHFKFPGRDFLHLESGNPTHRLLCQTICPVIPGEEFLCDYHTLLRDTTCQCTACYNACYT